MCQGRLTAESSSGGQPVKSAGTHLFLPGKHLRCLKAACIFSTIFLLPSFQVFGEAWPAPPPSHARAPPPIPAALLAITFQNSKAFQLQPVVPRKPFHSLPGHCLDVEPRSLTPGEKDEPAAIAPLALLPTLKSRILGHAHPYSPKQVPSPALPIPAGATACLKTVA